MVKVHILELIPYKSKEIAYILYVAELCQQ